MHSDGEEVSLQLYNPNGARTAAAAERRVIDAKFGGCPIVDTMFSLVIDALVCPAQHFRFQFGSLGALQNILHFVVTVIAESASHCESNVRIFTLQIVQMLELKDGPIFACSNNNINEA